MVIIKRKRNTGKTTMLLHAMVIDPFSFYVAATDLCADTAHRLAGILGLELKRDRFMSITEPRIKLLLQNDRIMFVDDIYQVFLSNLETALELVPRASIITVPEDSDATGI